MSPLLDFSKRKLNLIEEKEKFVQEKIDLKFRINDYSEENIKLKTKVCMLEKEITKLEKIIEEITNQ